MREVRIALLEADVALPVVREFVDKATEQAVGQQVLRSVTPGQQVVKIVHDALVEMLGAEASELNVDVTPPAVVMMVGLQGSGKTTTTAKLAKRLTDKGRKKVLMASLDVAAPGRAGAARRARPPGDVATLADRAGPAAGRDRPARAAVGQAPGLRRAAARHGRPPPRRSGADGRDEGGRLRLAVRTKSCSSSTR
jgi:Mrp family chromosome partitioning ATPase